MKRYFPYILLFILFFNLASKIYRIDEPSKYIFDEVYYAFTAEQIVKGNVDVYNVHAQPPKGVAYEWTHPPLSKLIIAFFVEQFGETSFAWRISSVLFSTGIVLLTALITLALFQSPKAALLAAFFLTLDGLFFVQSRIAMCDVHLLFFMLFGLYFYIRWQKDKEQLLYLFASGAGVGAAMSVKWSAVYLCAAIGVDLLRTLVRYRELPNKNWIVWLVVAYVCVPIAVYLAVHSHFFSIGYSWADFVELHRQMFFYHSKLKATHNYQSTPLQWMFNLRPTWMYVDYTVKGQLANIYNLGNYVLLYGGVLAAIYCFYQLLRSWRWELWMLLLCYFMFWVPWVLSPRIAFFHHYTPAVPLLSIMLGYSVCDHGERCEGRSFLAMNVLIAVVICFLLIYPFISGLHLPKNVAELLYYVIEKPK